MTLAGVNENREIGGHRNLEARRTSSRVLSSVSHTSPRINCHQGRMLRENPLQRGMVVRGSTHGAILTSLDGRYRTE